jgi:hypothetical protein
MTDRVKKKRQIKKTASFTIFHKTVKDPGLADRIVWRLHGERFSTWHRPRSTQRPSISLAIGSESLCVVAKPDSAWSERVHLLGG